MPNPSYLNNGGELEYFKWDPLDHGFEDMARNWSEIDANSALSDKPESACEGSRPEAFKPPADAIRPERLIGSA